MRSFNILAVLASLTAVVTSSTIAAREDVDWKYSVGWDGVTLPANEIGTPVTSIGNSTHLEKRAVGGVYICTDIHWGGRCGYAVQAINQCIVLGSDWNKQISSFGPDPCTVCYASAYSNCGRNQSPTTGDSWAFNYPGDATGGLSNPATSWNDKISSFICEATACTGAPAGPLNG